MATRAVTLTPIPWMRESGRVFVAVWTGLLNGDDGTPIEMALYADRSISVFGTFGAGGNLIWEGTNDPTLVATLPPANYQTLHDPQGVALGTITAAKITPIEEITHWMRPRVSAGDGTTSLTVQLLLREA